MRPPALVASTLDTSEGNLTFHYRVTRWLLQYEGMPVDNHFPDPWLQYTFARNDNYRKQWRKTPFLQAEAICSMLDAVEQVALDWWREVPLCNQPPVIRGYLGV